MSTLKTQVWLQVWVEPAQSQYSRVLRLLLGKNYLLDKMINNALASGNICRTTSPGASPVLCISKKELWLLKNWTPSPWITSTHYPWECNWLITFSTPAGPPNWKCATHMKFRTSSLFMPSRTFWTFEKIMWTKRSSWLLPVLHPWYHA